MFNCSELMLVTQLVNVERILGLAELGADGAGVAGAAGHVVGLDMVAEVGAVARGVEAGQAPPHALHRPVHQALDIAYKDTQGNCVIWQGNTYQILLFNISTYKEIKIWFCLSKMSCSFSYSSCYTNGQDYLDIKVTFKQN